MFDNVFQIGYTSYTFDCEVILYKNGKIAIFYDNISPSIPVNSATTGIQSSDPALGLQVQLNTNYIHNDLALLFDQPADFIIDVEPASGTVAEGESQDITITYDSQDYEPGDYTQELGLLSNDPNMECTSSTTRCMFTYQHSLPETYMTWTTEIRFRVLL